MPRSSAIFCPSCGQQFFPDSLKFHLPACHKKQASVEVPCPGCDALVQRNFLEEHVRRCPDARAQERRSKPSERVPGKGGRGTASSRPNGKPTVSVLELERTLLILLGAAQRLKNDVASYEAEAAENQRALDGLRAQGIPEEDLRQPLGVLAETEAMQQDSARRFSNAMVKLAVFFQRIGPSAVPAAALHDPNSPWARARAALASDGHGAAAVAARAGWAPGSTSATAASIHVAHSPSETRIESDPAISLPMQDTSRSSLRNSTSDGRLRCPLCSRGFLPERLSAHQTICRKIASKKPRGTFSSAEKRLRALVTQAGGEYNGLKLVRGDKLARVGGAKSAPVEGQAELKSTWHSNWRQKHLEMQDIVSKVRGYSTGPMHSSSTTKRRYVANFTPGPFLDTLPPNPQSSMLPLDVPSAMIKSHQSKRSLISGAPKAHSDNLTSAPLATSSAASCALELEAEDTLNHINTETDAVLDWDDMGGFSELPGTTALVEDFSGAGTFLEEAASAESQLGRIKGVEDNQDEGIDPFLVLAGAASSNGYENGLLVDVDSTKDPCGFPNRLDSPSYARAPPPSAPPPPATSSTVLVLDSDGADVGGAGHIQAESVWTCDFCTFENPALFLTCEVCNQPRGEVVIGKTSHTTGTHARSSSVPAAQQKVEDSWAPKNVTPGTRAVYAHSCMGSGSVVSAGRTQEVVTVVRHHPASEGGGFTVFIPSLGRERMTVDERLNFDPVAVESCDVSTEGHVHPVGQSTPFGDPPLQNIDALQPTAAPAPAPAVAVKTTAPTHGSSMNRCVGCGREVPVANIELHNLRCPQLTSRASRAAKAVAAVKSGRIVSPHVQSRKTESRRQVQQGPRVAVPRVAVPRVGLPLASVPGAGVSSRPAGGSSPPPAPERDSPRVAPPAPPAASNRTVRGSGGGSTKASKTWAPAKPWGAAAGAAASVKSNQSKMSVPVLAASSTSRKGTASSSASDNSLPSYMRGTATSRSRQESDRW